MGELPNFGNVESEDSTSEGWDKVATTPAPEKPKTTKEELPDFGNAKPELSDSEGWDKVAATPPEDIATIEAQAAADKAALDKAEAAVASAPDSTQTPEEAAAAGKLAESSEALNDALAPQGEAPTVLAAAENAAATGTEKPEEKAATSETPPAEPTVAGGIIVPPALKEEAEANKAAIASGKKGVMARTASWINRNLPWIKPVLAFVGLASVLGSIRKDKMAIPYEEMKGKAAVSAQYEPTSDTSRVIDVTTETQGGLRPTLGVPEWWRLNVAEQKKMVSTEEFIRETFKWAPDYARKNFGEIDPSSQADIKNIVDRLADQGFTSMTIEKVFGSASGESQIGVQQQENIHLAEMRAKSVGENIMKSGAKAGMEVEQDIDKVTAKEIEPTQAEIAQIEQIADNKYDGDVRQLIANWNRDKDSFSPDEQDLLERAFDDNRSGGAKVQVGMGEKTVWSVNPWGLLLLAPLFLRKKKDNDQKPEPKPIVGGDGTGPEPTPTPPVVPIPTPTPEDQTPPSEVAKTEAKQPLVEVPTFSTIDTTPKPEMYSVALRDDLSEHWGKHPDIPYEDMTDETIDNFKLDGTDDKAARDYLSARILDAWQKHDTQARKDKQDAIDNATSLDDYGGFKELGPADYSKDEEQMQWAKAHASVLLELARSIKALPEDERMSVDYLDYLKKHQDEILGKTSSAK